MAAPALPDAALSVVAAGAGLVFTGSAVVVLVDALGFAVAAVDAIGLAVADLVDYDIGSLPVKTIPLPLLEALSCETATGLLVAALSTVDLLTAVLSVIAVLLLLSLVAALGAVVDALAGAAA